MKPCYFAAVMVGLILAASSALAQIPLVNQGLEPVSIAPGSQTFNLTVNGSGFTSTAVVNWNGSPRLTEVISNTQLKATINASDVAKAQTGWITVTNPPPHGGTSNVVFFPVTKLRSTVFMTPDNAFPGTNAAAVAVGDFNNDGNLDIAWIGSGIATTLNVSLGDGKGGFSAPIATSAYQVQQLVTGDFNGDGKLDIAELIHGALAIFLGNGDGTFTQSFFYNTVSLTTAALATADFNGDGCLDLYLSGQETGPILFEIWTGNCDGTFTSGGSNLTSFIPEIPALGDFNGDGYTDLVVGSLSGEVWLGFAGGCCNLFSTIPRLGFNLAAADVNHDGKLDLVDDAGCVLLGNGDGTFAPCLDLPYGGQINGFGDFNGDGYLDLVNTWILLGAGNGTFPTAFCCGGGGSLPGAVADFNNDGRLDVVTPNGNVYLQTLPPAVKLMPSGLSFGDQNVGTTSTPQTITMTNVGTTTLTINQITIGGTGRTQFAQTNDCGTSLGAGVSCTISVTFSPKRSGSLSATVVVSYKGTGSPQTAGLTGTGVTPATVSLLPTNLTFATQLVGTSSAAQTATLTNTGDQAVTISSIATSGAFSQTNNCPASLAVGANCQIQVVFTPTAAGAANGTLSVTDNATNSPQTVALSGQGTVMTISPISVNFGDQKVGTTSSAAPVTLTNIGTSAVSITGGGLTGADPGDFVLASNCGKSLAGGTSCTINVKFKPTATGARSATLNVVDNGGGSPQTVSLTGTGT